jgi:hypothetical protein
MGIIEPLRYDLKAGHDALLSDESLKQRLGDALVTVYAELWQLYAARASGASNFDSNAQRQ